MKTSLLFFFLLAGTFTFAQQSVDFDKKTILYDPSFWKEELHLNNDQYNRMQDINKEFYQKLMNAFREMRNDRNAFRVAYAQCWVTRNTQLWETMSARQKKKWKKITIAEQTMDASEMLFSE